MSGILNAVVGGGGASAPTDVYFSNTTLLLHGDGTNGAQNNTFLDSSSNNFTITRNGNTTQGTFSPFSQTGWSNYFDGSGDYLTAPANTAFQFGTGDLTIECFAYRTTSGTTNTLIQYGNASVTNYNDIAWSFYISSSNYATFDVSNGSTSTYITLTSNTLWPLNSWVHLAVVRSGNNFTMYQNGASVATGTTSQSFYTPSTPLLWVGRNHNAGTGDYSGYISNARLVKGTAVYTAAFTPPTAPLTAITNTSLLTCQSNRFIDNSTNAFAITPSGTPSVQAFSPFAPTAAYSATTNGGSGYFDGSGDYLSIASTSALAFGTGDFTVECWLNFAALPSSAKGILNGQSLGSFNFYYDGGTYASKIFSIGNRIVGQISYSFTPAINTWYHVAVTRSGTTLSLFINGNLATSVTSSTDYGTAAFDIGGDGGGGGTWSWNGYISNLRVVKGTAVYTGSTYTVPTAPLTAITNTQLLLKCTDAGIIDNAAKNDLETVGNAQISTTQSKFGSSSMYFDGTGDWLVSPASPNLILGTGDFTFEAWIYIASPSDSPIFDCRSAGLGTDGFTLTAFSSTVIRVFTSSTLISATVANYSSTWTHVAVVRSNGTTTLYVNGVSGGTTTSLGNLTNNTVVVGGGRYGGGGDPAIIAFLNGYIDDLRITKGVARYTSNFTVPSAAFPDK